MHLSFYRVILIYSDEDGLGSIANKMCTIVITNVHGTFASVTVGRGILEVIDEYIIMKTNTVIKLRK